MSTDGETHPVYIDKGRKTRVKTVAAQEESSMKEITERYTTHGDTLELHKLPSDASEEELEDHVRDVLGI